MGILNYTSADFCYYGCHLHFCPVLLLWPPLVTLPPTFVTMGILNYTSADFCYYGALIYTSVQFCYYGRPYLLRPTFCYYGRPYFNSPDFLLLWPPLFTIPQTFVTMAALIYTSIKFCYYINKTNKILDFVGPLNYLTT